MAKLYQVLEATFKMRINSNSEILPYIKKLSEMGKFDEPKKIAAIAILLDRLGKLEDEADVEKSLSDIITPETIDTSTSQIETPGVSSDATATQETPVEPIQPDTQEQVAVNPADNPPVDTTPTVSSFTPENIVDPTPTSDSTTVS